jgi:hypothetical protein
MRRRLDGRCKGLLEVISYESALNGVSRYRVDFLHRTVRDYLLRSEDIQRFILEESGSNGKIWVNSFHATFLTLHVMSNLQLDLARLQRNWEELFHFAYLAIQEGADPSTIDRVLDQAEIKLNGGDVLPTLCLACEYDLLHYVKHRISERSFMGLPSDTQHVMADNILTNALIPNPVSGELSPDLVSYLLSLGANPHTPSYEVN